MIRLIAALCAALTGGCSNARKAAGATATATTLSPAIAYSVAANASRNGTQHASLWLGADPASYTTEINATLLQALSQGRDVSGLWLKPAWKYMGTSGDFDFLACYTPIGNQRTLYRIKKSELNLTETFALTSAESRWRDFTPENQPGLSQPISQELTYPALQLLRPQSTDPSPFNLHYGVSPFEAGRSNWVTAPR